MTGLIVLRAIKPGLQYNFVRFFILVLRKRQRVVIYLNGVVSVRSVVHYIQKRWNCRTERVGKGLDSLIRTSGEKKRTSLEKELVKRQEASRVVFVHRSCRKKTKKK